MSIMTLSSSSSPHKQWRSHSQQRSESSSWASWSTTTHPPASSSTCPRCPRATAARMVTVCSPTFRASSWRSEIVVDKFLCQYPDHPRAPLGPAAPPRSSPRLYRSLMVKRAAVLHGHGAPGAPSPRAMVNHNQAGVPPASVRSANISTYSRHES